MNRETLAGIAGGTLGFIHGDVSGAYYGYKAARKLTQMVGKRTIAQRRGKIVPRININNTPKSMGAKSKSSIMSTSSMRSNKRRKTFRQSVHETGATRTVITKSHVRKKKRPIKVSKSLRDKIHKVVDSKDYLGKHREIGYGIMQWQTQFSNKQNVLDITHFRLNAADPLFSIQKIVDAASVLWNQKAMAIDKGIVSNNFDRNTLKVRVINSYCQYTFRNNSQREVFLKLMECRPRNRSVLGDPQGVWVATLAANSTGPGIAGLGFGSNQNSITQNEIYTNPNMLPAWRALFKYVEFQVIIPPGGMYQHVVQGPKNQVFDCAKFFNGNLQLNIHPEACWLLAAYWPDLLTTSGNNYGRFIKNPANLQGIVYESLCHYNLAIPEQAGFTPRLGALPPSGTAQTLTERQWSYAFKTYPSSATLVDGETLWRVDDDQPATVETTP